MINFFRDWRLGIGDRRLGPLTLERLIPTLFLLLVTLSLYLLTLAQSPVLGDPTEYTFIAHVLGIAHPPGYAFITVAGKLFQSLIPVGTVAWRMHLLSAVMGTLAAFFVYGAVKAAIPHSAFRIPPSLVALFAGLTAATAVDHWQHSIHANPHIITATFTAANLFLLTKWRSGKVAEWQSGEGAGESRAARKWLYLFSLSAGLGVTHHPLTVFGFPAYALFILSVWLKTTSRALPAPRPLRLITKTVQRQWPTLLKMFGFALLGLSLWLYYPLRSPHVPFGPTGMNTLNGFLDHVLARGLSESLPYFSLAEQPLRLTVFWSILRLQFSLPVIALAVFGLLTPLIVRVKVSFARRWQSGKAAERQSDGVTLSFPPFTPSAVQLVTLYGLTFLCFYAFVISLRAQDIMAYLLGPLLIVGILAGVGLGQLLVLLGRFFGGERRPLYLLTAFFFLLGPAVNVIRNAPHVSLRDYSEGSDYVTAVFERFNGGGESATLLNDWEHMTPLWYAQFVQERWPDPADVEPVLVSTARPWPESVFAYLPGGPVYLSNYRREIVDAGFRLRPRGAFYQVVEPGDTSIPPELTRVSAAGGEIEVVGALVGETAVAAGDLIPLTLAMRAPVTPTHHYVPVVSVGDASSPRQLNYTFTTDSHLLTTQWRPGEVIVERFDLALPHDLPGGTYPLTVDLKNLETDAVVPLGLELDPLAVTEQPGTMRTDHLLANFRQRVGLAAAVAQRDGRYRAPWPEPITARPGETINLRLTWQALAKAEESYTVFIHLIDPANRPLVSLDYTPLGGSAPTHLWFPKWLPGQRYLDPYRLTIPPGLPPGDYLIEVGLYEMVSHRRLHISDAVGNLAGDRYILGRVVVTE